MKKIISILFAAGFAVFAMVGLAQAAPVSGPALQAGIVANQSLVQQTHGWHRRLEYGWHRGRRRWHRHGYRAPRNCWRANRICRRNFGYGWRYRRCMVRRGC